MYIVCFTEYNYKAVYPVDTLALKDIADPNSLL